MCECKDTVKNSIVEAASNNGILEVKVWEGQLNSPFEYRGFNFNIQTIESLAEMVKGKAMPELAVILCNEHGIEVILNNDEDQRPKDKLRLKYDISTTIKEWKSSIVGSKVNQKDFVNFLKKREVEELPDKETLLGAAQYLKIATSIVGDFQYDDNNNIAFSFKIQDMEQVARIPSEFIINAPILECIEDKTYQVKCELELIKPSSEGDKPLFKVTFFDLDKVYKQATKDAMQKLKELLPEYLILTGSNS